VRALIRAPQHGKFLNGKVFRSIHLFKVTGVETQDNHLKWEVVEKTFRTTALISELLLFYPKLTFMNCTLRNIWTCIIEFYTYSGEMSLQVCRKNALIRFVAHSFQMKRKSFVYKQTKQKIYPRKNVSWTVRIESLSSGKKNYSKRCAEV